jgi:hypothetical protein
MTLVKVISGGQCGVDVAALRAAKAHGLQTGGTMPRGFRTLLGPRPEYAAAFGVIEHKDSSYSPRTFCNVATGDGTLRLAADYESAGEQTTWAAIVRYRRPYFDVTLSLSELSPGEWMFVPDLLFDKVVDWIRANKIATLNVAGNSEWTAPGIEKFAEVYLGLVFQHFGQEKKP